MDDLEFYFLSYSSNDGTGSFDLQAIRACKYLVSDYLLLHEDKDFSGMKLADCILMVQDDVKLVDRGGVHYIGVSILLSCMYI